jgi:phage host-nuclease inhibitor protein Gam
MRPWTRPRPTPKPNPLPCWNVWHRKDELFSDRKRSIDGPSGRFGFRLSTSLKPLRGWTWEKILGALQALGQTAYVRAKYEVNKEALGLESDERLAVIGVRRKIKDEFWYEIKEEEIAPK